MKIALFGGIYSNHLALAAAIDDAHRRNVDQIYCLGDLGAFGPHPDHVFPLLQGADVQCVQGNYDNSIGHRLDDCQCGYTDPRDNHFAQISYEYTLANTSDENKKWLRTLPTEIRFDVQGLRILLCHGSPRRTNEFLWESTTSTAFLNRLADDCGADVIIGTHTGIHWERQLSQGRRFINVGVLGRPENDGQTKVWYTLLSIGEPVPSLPTIQQGSSTAPLPPSPLPNRVGETPFAGQGKFTEQTSVVANGDINMEFIPLAYDHERLAAEMRVEKLPEEFVETILSGWWSTCLEVLPAKERMRGRY